jgi:hypothetical protein
MFLRFLAFGFTLALIAPHSFATGLKPTKPPRERIRSGTEITVSNYSKDSNTFEIIMTHETSQGPNYARPEDLQAAIKMEGSTAEFIKLMTKDLSAIYVLKKDLPLLWPKEVEARRKAKKSPKHR